jgi:hypothetical protein
MVSVCSASAGLPTHPQGECLPASDCRTAGTLADTAGCRKKKAADLRDVSRFTERRIGRLCSAIQATAVFVVTTHEVGYFAPNLYCIHIGDNNFLWLPTRSDSCGTYSLSPGPTAHNGEGQIAAARWIIQARPGRQAGGAIDCRGVACGLLRLCGSESLLATKNGPLCHGWNIPLGYRVRHRLRHSAAPP